MNLRSREQIIRFRNDISSGKEKLAIKCIIPENIPMPQFNYITEHILKLVPKRGKEFEGCNCNGKKRCSKVQCECRILAARIGEQVDCFYRCKCQWSCVDASKQKSPRVSLRYIDAEHGFGVFAEETIKKNAFIGRYVGEAKPYSAFDSTNHVDTKYTMSVECFLSQDTVMIDSREYGNFTRFINHSCQSNVINKTVYSGTHRLPYPTFYADKIILPGEQLFLYYGMDYFSLRGLRCNCGHCN